MKRKNLPESDNNKIINALPNQLSVENQMRIKLFNLFSVFYDFSQEHMVRPRIHMADPKRHRRIWEGLLAPVRGAQILDLACGTGNLIPFIHESNVYTGLDISYRMLKRAVRKAQAKGFQKDEFIHGDAEDIPFTKRSFDIIIMDTALHMIPNYKRSIDEIARVLRKNGTFFCAAPVVGIYNGFDKKWKKIADKRSLHSITVSDIHEACSDADLDCFKMDKNGGVFYFRAQKLK